MTAKTQAAYEAEIEAQGEAIVSGVADGTLTEDEGIAQMKTLINTALHPRDTAATEGDTA